MKVTRTIWLIVWVMVLVAIETPAGILTFIHEGYGDISGTLDGVGFSTSGFVITSTANTANRQAYASGWFIDHISSTISIDGLGDLDFVTATRTYSNTVIPEVGFSRAGINGADLFQGPTAAWDMLGPIGPIYGAGDLLQWVASPVQTDKGVLYFDTDTTKGVFTAIPEPTTLTLLALGGLLLRRRKN